MNKRLKQWGNLKGRESVRLGAARSRIGARLSSKGGSFLIRVIVDWGVYYEAKGGGFRYFREILPRISKTSGFEVVLVSDLDASVEAPADTPLVKTRITPKGHWFPDGRVKRLLSTARKKIDAAYWRVKMAGKLDGAVFHSPYYTVCPLDAIPQVVTVHDLITEKFPAETAASSFDVIRRQKAESIRSATRLIAVSQKTRDDLCEIFSVSPDKVDVIPHGVDFNFFSAALPAEDQQRFRTTHGLNAPYLLHVGGRLNHKNFARLLEAFATSRFRQDTLLVAAGEPWDDNERSMADRFGVRDRLRLVTHPSDGDLRALYRLARVFVCPSFYEGFGLPLLEAMAGGAPVAAGRGGSIPEVVGDAGVLFDPFDCQDIASKIESLLDESKAAHYIELGRRRAAHFTWDRTAIDTMRCYERAVQSQE